MKIGFGMQDPESSSAAVPEAEKDLPPKSVLPSRREKGRIFSQACPLFNRRFNQ